MLGQGELTPDSVRPSRIQAFPPILLSVCLLALARPALAQTTGTIEGQVTDENGASLPGVTVEVASPSLGTRTETTSADGRFRFPTLPPGEYAVAGSLPDFGKVQKKARVTLDGTATVNMSLRLSTSAEVTVTGQAPPVDSTSTTTGTSYPSSVITNLPVSRNYAEIVRSNPGVSTDRGATEGRSLALTVYGATSAENQWIIDGVNTTNVFKGVQGKAINNEFVQEVEVKTGGYQAEYGRALGGVVNVITKSGGNQFHGDGFIYYDSTDTAAEQQFKPGDSAIYQMRTVDGQRLDYGFDLGGFLLKDRLWFFAAYNRVTLDGHLSRAASSTYVPASARFPFDSAANLYSGKLTWNIASSSTLVGTVFADPSSTSGAAGADPRQGLGALGVTPPVSLDPSTWYSARSQGGTDYGLRLTQLFGSKAIATLQGSYHKDNNTLTPPPGVRYIDLSCAGGTLEDPCNPPPEPNSITGGYGRVNGVQDHSTSSRKQIAGALTLYEGNHEIKAGGDYMDGQTEALSFWTGGQVVRLYNEYGQSYYMHRFYAVSPADPTLVPNRVDAARVLDYGAFLQDSWRISPGLTFNLGLRWDGEVTRDYAGQTVLQFDNQWQPRIGVLWDPWRDGATKVYAFAGRFSYALPTVAAALAFGSISQLVTFNFDPVSVVQDPKVIKHEEMVPEAVGSWSVPVDQGVKPSSSDELTIGIERLLTPTLTLGLKGTYRTLNNTLEDRCDLDYTSPETNYSSCALINPGSSGKFASGDMPTCNGLTDSPEWYQCYPQGPATPEVKRIYRGLELFARQTVGNSLWLQASFVYSSLRGNYDGGVNQGVYGQTNPGVNSDFDFPLLWHNSYGILALDRPYRFRFDGFWTTPWRLIVGLNGFVESGAPLNQLGYFRDASGYSVFLVPRGSAGRLPTLWNTDLTLQYPMSIGPVIVTLAGYVFNVFNKQIAIDRDNSWSTPAMPAGFPETIYDPNQEQTNPYYGSVTGRSNPRMFRAALKVSF